MKIHYSPDMVCPYCKSEKFYIKQSYKCICEVSMRFDLNEEEAEPEELVTTAEHKTINKYVYCNSCRKRLFNVSELPTEV